MRVFLCLWAEPEGYVAVGSTVKVLSDQNHIVDLFCDKHDLHNIIKRTNKRAQKTSGAQRLVNKLRTALRYSRYLIRIIRATRENQPGVVIGYNRFGVLAAYMVKLFSRNTTLIYHNFDFDPSHYNGFLGRAETFVARTADLTIFPAEGRGIEYKKLANLKKEPLSVMNCFPLDWVHQRKNLLVPLLDQKGVQFDKLVVRLGMMGPYHALEATIKSVSTWNGNWGLILGGFATEEYLCELYALIKSLGVESKVVVLPNVSADLWVDILQSASLGICLYEDWHVSHEFMAGTSQKLNNYIVTGIPSIVPNNKDFIEFLQVHNISKMVDVNDPESISDAVNLLLDNDQEYQILSNNAKRAYRSTFNYEHQFSLVLDFIQVSSSQ